MRILWFSITASLYDNKRNRHNGGGWVESLERIVKISDNVELAIAFEHPSALFKDEIDGVTYYPINVGRSRMQNLKRHFTIADEEKLLLPHCMKIIDDYKPDIIQCFGSEWCFGLVAQHTTIPVVIHMQGSMPSYFNALYPPRYNKWTKLGYALSRLKIKDFCLSLFQEKRNRQRAEREKRILSSNAYFMGRTDWDKSIVKLFSPKSQYYICNEALRTSFYESKERWQPKNRDKVVLCTVGSGSLWKGIDVILKTAHILTESGILDFEWRLIGGMHSRQYIEYIEKIKFADVNATFVGVLQEDQLKQELTGCDIYVHPAYIDNSPNSLCEAMIMGVPCIASYVGGIPSLIEDGAEGKLVPANEPYYLAQQIIDLAHDKKTQRRYSDNGRTKALGRHDPDLIKRQLLSIYATITKHSHEKNH